MKDLVSLAEFAVRKSQRGGAEESEAFLLSRREIQVAIENNQIKSGEVQEIEGLALRVIKNKGLGFAPTNRLEKGAIEESVSSALSLAKQAVPDQFNGFARPANLSSIPSLYDQQAEDFTLTQALDYARLMLQTALEFDSRISVLAGEFLFISQQKAIANSWGIIGAERETFFEYALDGVVRDGGEVSDSRLEIAVVRFKDQVNVEKLAQNFARELVKSFGARPGESFRGRAILHPRAVARLFQSLIASLSAESVQRGTSTLKGKLGEEIAVKSLTIEDNGLIPGAPGSRSFDREGVPPQPLYLIRNGVLSSYLYNTYTAKKERRDSTGHAGGGIRSTPTISPTNLLIGGGKKSYQQLIRATKKGILITAFLGYPNPVSGDFSGAINCGFQINGGEMRPVSGVMVSGNIYQLLREISAISKEQELVLLGSFPITAPYLQVENLSIAGK